jgi:hypothetical protein
MHLLAAASLTKARYLPGGKSGAVFVELTGVEIEDPDKNGNNAVVTVASGIVCRTGSAAEDGGR